jgi:hypothetical protein
MKMWSLHNACSMSKAIDTQNTWYLLLFYCNNTSMNAPHCYIICTLPVLFSTVENIVFTTLQKRVRNFNFWGNIKNIALPFILFKLEYLFWLFRKKCRVEESNIQIVPLQAADGVVHVHLIIHWILMIILMKSLNFQVKLSS